MATDKFPKGYTKHRAPATSEIWNQYRWQGTMPPTELGVAAIERLLHTAQNSVYLPSAGRHSKDELLGLLHYELAVAQHGTNQAQAALHLERALQKFGTRTDYTPGQYLTRQALVGTIHLLHHRTSETERIHRLQQKATVRDMGKLVTAGAELAPHLDRKLRGEILGKALEIAFLGTFLANQDPDNTHIGMPTTDRQDRPITTNRIGFQDTISGMQTIGSTDINLYSYQGAEAAPYDVTKIQVKGHDNGEEELYDEDVLVLYGDRDLFIETARELGDYGRSLVDYKGTPDRSIGVALSNISLAQEVHNQTTFGPEN